MRFASPLVFAAALAATLAKDVNFDWTLSWITVNPDGHTADGDTGRIVPAINGEWPLPVVRVNMGDRIIARVTNKFLRPATNATVHFHGMFQNGTTEMDGAPWLSQCPIAPNGTLTYNFTVNQPGTYWYHTHIDNAYPDGYRQILLVDNDDAWFQDQVDEELFFTVSDWYHDLAVNIVENTFLSLYNPTGAEPVPDAFLVNDTQNSTWLVKPNTTYRIRIANIAAFASFAIMIIGHNFTIVEADGCYTKPQEAKSVLIGVGQRYSLLFKTGPDPNIAYQLVTVPDAGLFDVVPPDLQLNATNWLATSPDAETKVATPEEIFDWAMWGWATTPDYSGSFSPTTATASDFETFDDAELVPYDEMPLLKNVDKQITVEVSLTNLYDGINYAFFNDTSYVHAKVPTLFTALTAPSDDLALNETIYGTNTGTFVLEHNDVVELVLNNKDSGTHPFHLHGHLFQVANRAISKGNSTDDSYYSYDPSDPDNVFYDPPIRRDVLLVRPYSHFVIRWVADNPGVWFFHCHIDWHLTQGLAMLFVEAPVQLRQNMGGLSGIPQDHIDACKFASVPFQGNAAANTEDFLNLKGQNLQAKNLPAGFTARGIVALVFSCICAFVGMGFLAWYGLSDTPLGEAHTAERFLEEPVSESDIQQPQFNDQDHDPAHEPELHPPPQGIQAGRPF